MEGLRRLVTSRFVEVLLVAMLGEGRRQDKLV